MRSTALQKQHEKPHSGFLVQGIPIIFGKTGRDAGGRVVYTLESKEYGKSSNIFLVPFLFQILSPVFYIH